GAGAAGLPRARANPRGPTLRAQARPARRRRPPGRAVTVAAGPAVQVRGLARRFGPLDAVAGLDFEVGAGELFGLVGPDGAGKTTTLRMLAGVLRPSSGDARVGGVSLLDDPEAVKRDLAYMSQHASQHAQGR